MPTGLNSAKPNAAFSSHQERLCFPVGIRNENAFCISFYKFKWQLTMLPKNLSPPSNQSKACNCCPASGREEWTLEQPCSYLHSNRNFRERLVDIVGRETFWAAAPHRAAPGSWAMRCRLSVPKLCRTQSCTVVACWMPTSHSSQTHTLPVSDSDWISF